MYVENAKIIVIGFKKGTVIVNLKIIKFLYKLRIHKIYLLKNHLFPLPLFSVVPTLRKSHVSSL